VQHRDENVPGCDTAAPQHRPPEQHRYFVHRWHLLYGDRRDRF
jgi:hypothetical protein